MSRYARLAVVLVFPIFLLNCPSAPKPPENTVAAPAFNPGEGTYTTAQTVTLTSSTEGAEIRYTTDSTAPTATTGTVYSAPITVSATTKFLAMASKAGWADSPVVSATFTITGKVADVAFSPEPGTFDKAVQLTLSSATEGAEIYYTIDGSDPTPAKGTHYAGPIDIQTSTTLKAIAVKQSWDDSSIASGAFKLVLGVVADPTFSPAAGTYSATQVVAIASATEGARIRYTTDESMPTPSNGKDYSEPISVDASVKLRAIAYKVDYTDSQVASADYVIEKAPPIPPIADSEIAEARNAIARAREVDADFYDPDNYDAARRLLDEALAVRSTDVPSAREKLAGSKEKADLSFNNSVAKAAQDLSDRMNAARRKLVDIEADKFLLSDFQKTTAGIDEANGLFTKGDFSGGRSRAYQALKEMTDLKNRLQTRLDWVKMLRRDTEQYMKEAEETEAWKYAPDLKDKVNGLYLGGLEAFQGYRLDDAEEKFAAAREAAKDALRVSRENRDIRVAEEQKKTEALMIDVMKALTDASKLTIVTEDGTVITPQNWSEEDFLKEIERMEQEERQKAAPGGQSMLIPSDGSTVVLAETSEENLLAQAKQLWILGLKEKTAGNFEKAQDYFNEALRYIDIYKSYAVKGVYTVRLIPERRDCLWRIAEYKDIYGDPYLWPKIWRRNRKLIQNPDLIYPGWQLVIPPE